MANRTHRVRGRAPVRSCLHPPPPPPTPPGRWERAGARPVRGIIPRARERVRNAVLIRPQIPRSVSIPVTSAGRVTYEPVIGAALPAGPTSLPRAGRPRHRRPHTSLPPNPLLLDGDFRPAHHQRMNLNQGRRGQATMKGQRCYPGPQSLDISADLVFDVLPLVKSVATSGPHVTRSTMRLLQPHMPGSRVLSAITCAAPHAGPAPNLPLRALAARRGRVSSTHTCLRSRHRCRSAYNGRGGSPPYRKWRAPCVGSV